MPNALHYKIIILALPDVGNELNLDRNHRDGWRIAKMTAHPDGQKVILLMERDSVRP